MNTLRFTCTSLVGKNKAGHLPRDENGCFEICVGGLNVFNAARQYYPYEAAKEIFDASSSFMRRVNRGVLRAEWGHPKRDRMTDQEFIQRILNIDERYECGTHREIYLDFDRMMDDAGRPVIAIMSKFMPGGPYGQALEKRLTDKGENVCFSIRSFTEDGVTRTGIIERKIRQVITFDYVNEPGIIHAEKYRSPGLEQYDDEETALHRSDFISAYKNRVPGLVALESSSMSLEELFQVMNWSTDDSIGASSRKHTKPYWTRL